MNCVLRNAAINSVVQDQLYQDKFRVHKTCHSHLYIHISTHNLLVVVPAGHTLLLAHAYIVVSSCLLALST